MHASEVRSLQLSLAHAEQTLSYERWEHAKPGAMVSREAARLKPFEIEVERLAAEVARAQAEIGGNVFRIPEPALALLDKKIEQITKRANKLGVEAPKLTVTDETETEEIKKNGKVTGVREYVYVIVSGAAPKLGGWAFLATLQHEEAGTIVRRVPTTEHGETEALAHVVKLDGYRNAEPVCDHCGLDRNRKDTYVVYNDEARETKQVGRSCLKDFVGGLSPQKAASGLEWYFSILEDAGSYERDGFSGEIRVPVKYTIEEFLTHSALMIRTHGWTSRSAAGWDRQATADAAFQNMLDQINQEKDKQTGQPLWIDPETQDEETAAKTVEYLKSLDGESDFDHNLKVVASSKYIERRSAGIAAYGVVAYHKHIEREIKIAKEQERRAEKLNEHFGEIKDRLELTLTVMSVKERYREGYGAADESVYYITTMEDPEGRVFKWFGSYELDRGETYTGKWTVKKHDEWNGTKQTVINRPHGLEKGASS